MPRNCPNNLKMAPFKQQTFVGLLMIDKAHKCHIAKWNCLLGLDFPPKLTNWKNTSDKHRSWWEDNNKNRDDCSCFVFGFFAADVRSPKWNGLVERRQVGWVTAVWANSFHSNTLILLEERLTSCLGCVKLIVTDGSACGSWHLQSDLYSGTWTKRNNPVRSGVVAAICVCL